MTTIEKLNKIANNYLPGSKVEKKKTFGKKRNFYLSVNGLTIDIGNTVNQAIQTIKDIQKLWFED